MSADARLMSIREVSRWALREYEINYRRPITLRTPPIAQTRREQFISQAEYRHSMARHRLLVLGYITKP